MYSSVFIEGKIDGEKEETKAHLGLVLRPLNPSPPRGDFDFSAADEVAVASGTGVEAGLQ